MRICSVEGCNNTARGKGFCGKHYHKWYRYGDPLYTKPKKIFIIKECKIKGCKSKSFVKGFCNKHYQKFKKYGDPLYTKIEMHGLHSLPEYYIWKSMKQRCHNPNVERYSRYGGRGITVCDSWKNSFLSFYNDMGERPAPNFQIDRIDNDGNYEPENCHWITVVENNRKRSTIKLSIEKAEDIRKKYKLCNITKKELSVIYNVSFTTIHDILINKIWLNEI